MEPKIYLKEAMMIAGVSGVGAETGKVWETYMKLEKLSPLKNSIGEIGYEVRMYPGGQEPDEVHIGMQVKDTKIPPEYKILSLPASMYAEFEIYPSKGYTNSNAEINKWLSDNAEVYKQGILGNKNYAIEVYDERFKGNEDPESVVAMLIPIVAVSGEPPDLSPIILGPLSEFCGRIEQFAGPDISKKVLEGKDEMEFAKDPGKCSIWMKEALERLDNLTGEKIREQIMTACGRSCNTVNNTVTKNARQQRLLCTSEEDYLATLESAGNGVRYERDGDTLVQYYTPYEYGKDKYGKGIRCYCSLVNMLPEGIKASPTYCWCARAFNQAHWEYVLGRPVRVEMGDTALTGAKECKFIIHL